MVPENYDPNYVKNLVESIDADPEHKLPEGISGVIKNAVRWPGDSISGQMWYDVYGRFVDDYPVNTSRIIAEEPGGVFCTQNNKYIVHLIQPERAEAIG